MQWNGAERTRVGDIRSLRSPVPWRRGVFIASPWERASESERVLKLAIAEMHPMGFHLQSHRRNRTTLRPGNFLRPSQPSHRRAGRGTVQIAHPLPAQLKDILDARSEKVRVEGTMHSCAVLVALGHRCPRPTLGHVLKNLLRPRLIPFTPPRCDCAIHHDSRRERTMSDVHADGVRLAVHQVPGRDEFHLIALFLPREHAKKRPVPLGPCPQRRLVLRRHI